MGLLGKKVTEPSGVEPLFINTGKLFLRLRRPDKAGWEFIILKKDLRKYLLFEESVV